MRAGGVTALLVPMAALLLALFVTYRVEEEVQAAGRIVARAYQARADLLRLTAILRDTAGTPAASIAALRKSAGGAQASFAADIEGDSEAATALNELRPLIAARMEEIGRGAPGASAVMREIEARVSSLDRHEELRLAGASLQRDAARRRLFRVIILCGVAGPAGALSLHLLLTGRWVKRLRMVEENARRLAHGLPLQPSPGGSDEIASLAREIERAALLLGERERDLLASQRRYRELFDHSPIPYEETDREGVVRRFNQAVCRLLRITPEQMLGRHAWDFVSPDEQGPFRAAMLERIATGTEAAPFECGFLLEDGARIILDIRENLIRNHAGEVTGTVRSLVDVTERNLASVAARKVEQYALELRSRNEQLARALDAARSAAVAKSRFLASVSHELRTPLNGIIGFSELLHDGRLGPLSAEQRDALGDVLASARHLLQLISDILDLSKVEAGRMEFHPTRRRVLDIVSEVRDVIRPLAEKKAQTLSIEGPAGMIAHIDESRFKQVLYNYLSNAIKFTPEGGSIAVRVSMEGADRFRVDVEDTGVGIAEEELPRLFQEFAQLPNSRKAEQGTGLGLALTRHIVEAQGGSVSVRGKLGKGSVFSAVLPLEGAKAAES